MIPLRDSTAAEHGGIVVDIVVPRGVHGPINVLSEPAYKYPVKFEGHVRHGDLNAVDFRYNTVNTDRIAFVPRTSVQALFNPLQ